MLKKSWIQKLVVVYVSYHVYPRYKNTKKEAWLKEKKNDWTPWL